MPYNTSIPGWMHKADLEAIEHLSKVVRPGGSVLEIGAFLGRSTWAWCHSVPKDATVYTVDHWAWMPGETDYGPGNPGYPLDRTKTPKELFDSYVTDCPNLVAIQGNSNEVQLPVSDGHLFDLVFLDGSHGNPEVHEDIVRWGPRVRQGGILCGDDYWEGNETTPSTWPDIVSEVKAFAASVGKPVETLGAKLWAVRL